jgi:hypothetical protein
MRQTAVCRPRAQHRSATAHVHRPRRVIHTRSATSSSTDTSSLAAELNGMCNAALQAMLANDENRVQQLEDQLKALRSRAVEAEDLEADRMLWVLQRMLRHGMVEEVSELTGPYAAAVNRLVNQVQCLSGGPPCFCWLNQCFAQLFNVRN